MLYKTAPALRFIIGKTAGGAGRGPLLHASLSRWVAALGVGDLSNAETDAVELIGRLSDEVTLKDIRRHLHVLEKVRQGERSLGVEGGITQDAMERDLGRWGLA